MTIVVEMVEKVVVMDIMRTEKWMMGIMKCLRLVMLANDEDGVATVMSE